MFAESLRLRSFRTYEQAELELGSGVTVICGANGSGKTNLLEALYFGCTGRSCRTTNEREVVRFGDRVARVEVDVAGAAGGHRIAVGFTPGQPKHMSVDGEPVESLLSAPERPLLSVFLPERLELVKGPPGVRRAHLDRLVAALWPPRAENRRAFGRALAQRNALLAGVRDRRVDDGTIAAWDAELARCAVTLAADRRDAVAELAPYVAQTGAELGLPHELVIAYRSQAATMSELEFGALLEQRRGADVERGFTQSGPHRDELVLTHGGRELRAYGSQGQQRAALLALLLAERDLVEQTRGTAPVLLLDDVLSELDGVRRELLVARVAQAGQTLLTATEIEQLPAAIRERVRHVEVAGGGVRPAGVRVAA